MKSRDTKDRHHLNTSRLKNPTKVQETHVHVQNHTHQNEDHIKNLNTVAGQEANQEVNQGVEHKVETEKVNQVVIGKVLIIIKANIEVEVKVEAGLEVEVVN
jgi:hypothetical protein